MNSGANDAELCVCVCEKGVESRFVLLIHRVTTTSTEGRGGWVCVERKSMCYVSVCAEGGAGCKGIKDHVAFT